MIRRRHDARPDRDLTKQPARRSGARPWRAGVDARAIPGSELPLPVARRSAHLLGVRDGEPDPRLVRAGRDRFGAVAHGVRRAAIFRHADRPDDGSDQRPHRASQPADRHAGDLRAARRHPDDFRLPGRRHADDRADHRGADGRDPPVGSRRAQCAGGRDHAVGPADLRDGHRAHHDRTRRASPVRSQAPACLQSSAWAQPICS